MATRAVRSRRPAEAPEERDEAAHSVVGPRDALARAQVAHEPLVDVLGSATERDDEPPAVLQLFEQRPRWLRRAGAHHHGAVRREFAPTVAAVEDLEVDV